jgi:hypothetical protein
MAQESKYEALDRDITRAMLHAESVCLLKHKHNAHLGPSHRACDKLNQILGPSHQVRRNT